MAFGFIITRDHLEDEDVEIIGPRNIDPAIEAALRAGKGDTFRLYDDDGEKYYTGRALATEGDEDTEEFCAAPLDMFGAPDSGCTLIKWHGKSYRDIG